MTKEAVRNLSVSALEIEPADIVYDIGAGTGSVTCAMALKSCESMVYALEKEDYAVNLVKENMEKTGARNIIIRQAAAPDGIAAFPAADKVFIGGSTGNLKGIIETILARNDKVVFVITAVTLETISQSVDVLKNAGYGDGHYLCKHFPGAEVRTVQSDESRESSIYYKRSKDL